MEYSLTDGIRKGIIPFKKYTCENLWSNKCFRNVIRWDANRQELVWNDEEWNRVYDRYAEVGE